MHAKLAITHALSSLFGRAGGALQVDILRFDEAAQEALLRVPER